MTPQAFKVLDDYLISHERDIALGIEDFDYLRLVFAERFGRPPRSMPLGVTVAT